MPADIQTFIGNLTQLKTNNSPLPEKFEELIRIFYLTINELTDDDWISFKNFYARFKFFLNRYSPDSAQRKELDAFRKFIRFEARNSSDTQAFHNAWDILNWMVRLKENEVEKLVTSFFFSSKIKPKSTQDELTGLVDQIIPGIQPVICVNNIEELTTTIKIPIQNPELIYLEQILKKGDLVKFLHLELIKNKLVATAQTLVVIEPDFLLDATAISECFHQKRVDSNFYFLNKLTKSLPNELAFKGILIGQILDELVRSPKEFDLPSTLREEIIKNPIASIRIGKSGLQQIKQSIEKEHWEYLQKLAADQQGKKVWIEPTYFSSVYGIQGRIDLLNETNEKEGKNIIELKSGTPTNPNISSIAKENHKMQAVCYDMILESTYPNSTQNTVAVYYSKKTDFNFTPYRFIVSEYKEKSAVLKIRNEIVSKILALSQQDYSTFNELLHPNFATHLPWYLSSPLEDFQNYLSQESISRIYYRELLSFVLRELIIAKIGTGRGEEEGRSENGFAALWLNDTASKKEHFQIIPALQIVHIEQSTGTITVHFTEIPHSFRVGDLIIFYPKTKYGYDALKNQILKGNIKSLSKNELEISLYNKQMDYSFLELYETWAIEPDMYENNYWSICSGLMNILKCTSEKKELLLGHRAPQSNTIQPSPIIGLNENQNEVLHLALSAQDYFLLQGPPGTGKTSMFLLNFIRKTLAQPEPPNIFVLAFTNKAVEKIVETFNHPRSGEPLSFIRFGNRNLKDPNNFIEKTKKEPFGSWRDLLTRHQIFISTVSSFHNNWMEWKSFISFDVLVVDEASQLTEADLAGILVLFKKFILIGDHKQLPAVVTQNEKSTVVNHPILNKLGIQDWRTSLFERLFNNAAAKNWNHAFGQLTHHFRMHQEIATHLQKHYLRPLIPGTEAQKLKIPLKRLAWIPTFTEGDLKKNMAEAEAINRLTKELIEIEGFLPAEIGIICPFKAQITAIKGFLNQDWKEQITIDTVERYQGDERKIIIFSTTISNPLQINTIQSINKRDPLRTDRKLLVSISRAVERFYIFGNPKALQAAPAYSELLEELS